ncbi:hypothetical protein [Methylobacterium planeticum]|uniref:Uncharacterized protein n=1 Tax=Methylobacterium planeticum TaxID=2615211 RepID=A0A6N6MSG7_9HYPH|nr:hypothetical protein [Methylobacterium planeticum]KAB1073284.1 hypothetical protein F6X51_13200 [Methylobacterium planeticum]
MTLRNLAARILAAALLVAGAVPALAQGIDSRHSPFPPSAYSGFAGPSSPRFALLPLTQDRPAPAYRFSGQHAGGPADALRR